MHSLDLHCDFGLPLDPETKSNLVNIFRGRASYPGVEKRVQIVREPVGDGRKDYLHLGITKLFYVGRNLLKAICG